jgi:hypothetical protein
MKKTQYIYLITVYTSKFQATCIYPAIEIWTCVSAGETSQPSASPRVLEKSKLKKIKGERKYTSAYELRNVPTLGRLGVTSRLGYAICVHV